MVLVADDLAVARIRSNWCRASSSPARWRGWCLATPRDSVSYGGYHGNKVVNEICRRTVAGRVIYAKCNENKVNRVRLYAWYEMFSSVTRSRAGKSE